MRVVRRKLTGSRHYTHEFDLIHKSKEITQVFDCALDLGSGPVPKNPFGASISYGVDIRSFDVNQDVKECHLGFHSIPFQSNFFDAVTAYDLLEHIPRISVSNEASSFPFIFLMNEVWRVLKTGGLFYSSTPCYPMKEAFQDPTHVNIMTEDTLRLYFSGKSWARIYGFVGSFRLVEEGWLGPHHLCLLQKTSDIPTREINSDQRE
jgi:SAM-dependent methyltransferase